MGEVTGEVTGGTDNAMACLSVERNLFRFLESRIKNHTCFVSRWRGGFSATLVMVIVSNGTSSVIHHSNGTSSVLRARAYEYSLALRGDLTIQFCNRPVNELRTHRVELDTRADRFVRPTSRTIAVLAEFL